MNIFSSFFEVEISIALQSLTQNLRFKFDLSEYRFEWVKQSKKLSQIVALREEKNILMEILAQISFWRSYIWREHYYVSRRIIFPLTVATKRKNPMTKSSPAMTICRNLLPHGVKNGERYKTGHGNNSWLLSRKISFAELKWWKTS